MAEFINYIIDSPIQPVKTNVLWVKKGVLHYYNKKWIPIAGGGSGNITYPIIDGEGNYSAVLAYSDNKALNISSIALGYNNISRNFAEASFGKYNLSHESDDPSIATLFSIGNGSKEERKNAFEVKEDGEIYIGKRTESLQTILYNLENYFLNDKYDILEQQLSDLDAYSRSNIEALKELIKANKLDLQNYKEYVEDGFLKMNTSITQTAEEIRLEASKIEERLNGRITEAESSFSITAEEIRAEVSRVETDVNGKIVEANSLISQTADEIRTEVSRVELDINGKITEANSRIEQTANSITSEVYEIEKTLDGRIKENKSSIEQTSEKIESAVESLTILDNKVLNQESKINQTAESIELLVTKVETQSSKIEENTANIEINKNAITSKVEQDEFDALSSAVEETGREFTEVKQTVSGIKTTIQDQTGKVTRLEETVTGLTVKTGTLEADIESLKNQSDGAIDTHFGKVTPTLDNEPAVNWDTEELKKEHTGDLYYNNTTGEAFRWSYDPETETYFWVELTDSALTDALDKISKLEVAINGKVTIFYNTPSNYKEGDLWFVHVNYPDYHFTEGQLLTATDKSETFNASHWEDKTNFASHAEVTESVTQLNNYIDEVFSDNILTVAEIKQIKEAKKNFESLFSEVKESYSYLVISAVATDSDKTALRDAYNNLTHETNGSYTLLIAAIDALIALDKEEGDDVLDIEVVEGLLAEYENAYELFSKDLTTYYAASAKLTEGIQNYLSSASDYIKDVMSDGVLSPIEKKQLFDIWRQIKEEFIANRGIAVNYKIIKLNEEGNYVKNEELYNDKDYFDIYEAYLNNYLPLEGIFIGSDWGFNDLNIASSTPEGYNTEYIATSFNNYYNALTSFAEMIAEITIAITDAHDKAIALANKLQEHLDPKDEISVIGKGVILSSIIGVKKSDDDTFVSAINAQALDNEEISTVDETHGRVVYAGGIPSTNNWNDSTTVIYEDGHVKFKSGEISDSVSIGETRQSILDKANTLQESLGVGGNTIIDGGLVLSTLLGVVDTEGNLKSVLNASDISKDTVTNHGRIVFAGGIENSEDWTTAKTLIYEDGYIHFRWGKIDDGVEIGSALIKSVISGTIDLFSYPENGVLVPLFQVNKDDTGKIVSISSVYDFYVNGNLIVTGDTSTEGTGSNPEVAGTLIGITVNGETYKDPVNGILTIPDYPTSLEWSAINGKPTKLSEFLNDSGFITSAALVGYATQSWVEGKGYITGITLTGDDYISVNGYKLSLAIDAQGGLENTGQGLGVGNLRHKLTFGDKSFDGGADKTITASDLGALTSITNAMVTTALGYTPYNSTNPNGYISGIDKSMVASAVGASGNAGKVLSSTGGDLGWISLPTTLPASDVYAWAKKSSLALVDVPDLSSKYLSTAGGTISGYVIAGDLTPADGKNKIPFAAAYTGYLDTGWVGSFGNSEGGVLLGYRSNKNIAIIGTSKSGSLSVVPDGGNVAIGIDTVPTDKLYVYGKWSSDAISVAHFAKGDAKNSVVTISNTQGRVNLAAMFDGSGFVGSVDSKPLILATGNTARVTIAADGITTFKKKIVVTDTDAALYIQRTGTYANEPCICYCNGTTTIGSIGIKDDGPFYWDTSTRYTIIHSGNYSSYALPLSGGTISGAAVLDINRSDGPYSSIIKFSNRSGELGYIGFSPEKNLSIWNDLNSAAYTVIHSGNIGSYNAGSATKLATTRSIWGQNFNGTGDVSGSLANVRHIYMAAGYHIVMGDVSVLTLDGNNLQIGQGVTGNTIVGGGNVLIGSTSDNGGKLQLDGYMHIKSKNGYITLTNGMESGRATMDLSVRDNSYASIQTSLYGVDYICPLALNPNGGNVLIGTTTDSGYKLDVNGTARCGKDEDGADLLVFNMGREWRFQQSGVGASAALVLRTLQNGKYFHLRNNANETAFTYVAQNGANRLYAGCPTEINSTLKVNGAVTMSSTLSVGSTIQSKHHQFVEENYSANTGNGKIGCFDFPYSVSVQIGGYGKTENDREFCFRVLNNAWNKDLFHVGNNGKVGIGIETPEAELHVNGDIIMAGDLSSTSDMRLKQRIDDVILDLNTIAEMPIFTFRWKDGRDGRLHLGSSAQYWEKPAPWLVIGDSSKTLNYAVLGVAGMKSLAVTAVDHETRIKMLERKVNELETENRRLRYGN